MEKLTTDMMCCTNITEDELRDNKEIKTNFRETISWEYFCYVKENPITWKIPTSILFGEKDNLTSYATIFEFTKQTNATLIVMRNGEHWFHTKEQMKFLDDWIKMSTR